MDADVTVTITADRKLHYAFRVDDTNGDRIEIGDITDWEFQINAGSFLDLTTTSTGVRLVNSDDAAMVDDDGTTAGERLTTGGLGGFVVDGLQEHESSSNLDIPLLGNRIRDEHGETQASIELVFADLTDLDTITFRILQETKNGVDTLVGLAVITIDKGGGCCFVHRKHDR